MTLPVIFIPAARLELIAAQDWYEREAIGLAARFRTAVEVQVERIATNPLQFPDVLSDIRRDPEIWQTRV